MRRLPLALAVSLLVPSSAFAEVVISEIHYNSPSGGDYEFVELHNTGPASVDVSGWGFTSGITFLFPADTSLLPGAYLTVASSREALLRAYPSLPSASIAGEYDGSLANEGERLVLADAAETPRDIVDYDDDAPWDFLADGFGASLERLCFTVDGNAPENWKASTVPSSPETFEGSPGAPGADLACPPPIPVRPPVFISEIMYHPVLEEAIEDYHEFIEIHNRGLETLPLDGWRIAGGVDFAFPAGASIGPGAYLVIAKDRVKLAAVASYGLSEPSILGDYARSLDNGGDKVASISADGRGIDSVSYDDDFPWPLAADALGAGEEWLKAAVLPLTDHRYQGHSLERVSFQTDSNEVSNWVPSPLDGATPGRVASSARDIPLSIVTELLVQPAEGGDDLIRANKAVLVQALFSPTGPSGGADIEFFVDDVILGGEKVIETLPLFDDGVGGGDLVPGDRVYSATLAPHADNTIVRYRIRADRGSGLEVVSPRPSDPLEWHAYFVTPNIVSSTRTYHIFITPANWARLWTNIQGGRVSGCAPHPTWDSQVPAVFVHEGQVVDARVRYQGSRWNRVNGPGIASWSFPRPSSGPLLGLSWRVALPRYSQLDGQGEVTLNKLTQGCPGYNAGVGYRLFAAAGLPASNTQFIRLHVNGGYYRYMMQLERPGEEMMRRYHREVSERNPGAPREPVGHLYKSVGCNCDEGPYGWGDWRALTPSCGHPKEVRYAYTFDKKTLGWAGNAELVQLIEDLHAAKRAGMEPLRAYFEERFDVDLLLSYVAIINWSVPFDDMFQNHFVYQRVSDGKWILFPWDLDQNFGEWQGPTSSIYMGEIGNPSNRSGWVHYLKDAFLKAFREEFDDRLLLLNNTLLHPDNISRLVDDVTARADPAEAQRAAAPASCSFPGRAASFKAFALARFNVVNTQVAKLVLDAGPDQMVFAGTQVQFDARETEPDPGPEATYAWDNGMVGDFPTWTFPAPGVFDVTLAVTVRGIEFKDTVKITVIPRPEAAIRERGGLVVFETENYFQNERNGALNTWWEPDSIQPGFSGTSYMEAKQSRRQTFPQRYVGLSPELRYTILFETPGTYRVWLRAFSTTTISDSVYVGLGGAERPSGFAHQFLLDPANYLWSGDTRTQGPQTFTIPEPGIYLFSIWVRDSLQVIDKVILTQDSGFTPADLGPPESETVPVDGPRAFVRGDADGNGSLNVSDAIAIILHLFGGKPVSCEDPSDSDDSGGVDVTDAITLLSYLFQRGPLLAPPFPGAGFDPTPDVFPCGDASP